MLQSDNARKKRGKTNNMQPIIEIEANKEISDTYIYLAISPTR